MNVPKPSSRDSVNSIAGSRADVANDRVPQPSGFGTAAPPDGGPVDKGKEERDPRFAELEAAINAEVTSNGKKPSRRTPGKRPRKRKPGGSTDRQAVSQAKEFVRRLAEITFGEFGHELDRAEFSRVANEFSSALIPKRRPGRKPLLRITQAYEAWKARVRGIALYRGHIHRWEKLDHYRRKHEERKLMAAIRSRYRRDVRRASR
jgi:hypothetical protein